MTAHSFAGPAEAPGGSARKGFTSTHRQSLRAEPGARPGPREHAELFPTGKDPEWRRGKEEGREEETLRSEGPGQHSVRARAR